MDYTHGYWLIAIDPALIAGNAGGFSPHPIEEMIKTKSIARR